MCESCSLDVKLSVCHRHPLVQRSANCGPWAKACVCDESLKSWLSGPLQENFANLWSTLRISRPQFTCLLSLSLLYPCPLSVKKSVCHSLMSWDCLIWFRTSYFTFLRCRCLICKKGWYNKDFGVRRCTKWAYVKKAPSIMSGSKQARSFYFPSFYFFPKEYDHFSMKKKIKLHCSVGGNLL